MTATYAELALENARLRSKVAELQSSLTHTHHSTAPHTQLQQQQQGIDSDSAQPTTRTTPPPTPTLSLSAVTRLSGSDILRYSRHLLCGELGGRPVLVQLALMRSSVLVVGAGGLGCPVLQQLAGAGVGRLGIVDPDVIDASNLPRQSLFDERHLGRGKAEVAAERVAQVNPACRVQPHPTSFSALNCMQLASSYDLLMDCSDNVPTRYLCSDVAVALGIPCVSGAALRLEGQLTVYGWRDGPCYRCIHPHPPPLGAITNCNEGGVLNAVTACIGALQALEAIKIIAHSADAAAAAPTAPSDCGLTVLSGRLLCFDAASTAFRVVRLRGRSPTCIACSPQGRTRLRAAIAQEPPPSPAPSQALLKQCEGQSGAQCSYLSSLSDGPPLLDPSDCPLPVGCSVAPSVLASAYLASPSSSAPFLVLDVRPSLQFDICHLPHAVNVPLAQLPHSTRSIADLLHTHTQQAIHRWEQQQPSPPIAPPPPSLFVVCRRGVDSARAVAIIHAAASHTSNGSHQSGKEEEDEGEGAERAPWSVFNVEGGLIAWTERVDPTFPLY